MKFFVLISVLLIGVVLVHCYDDISEPGTRSRSRGFFPQVRVGRSDGFSIPGASKKATKMTVFPRVGRDSPKLYTGNDCDNRHNTRDTSSGLWFGPRLGVHKRDDYEMPLSYVLMNGGGTRMEYIPISEKDLDLENDGDRSGYY